DDIKSVARNVAFSLALYTGQMCTAPQNIYVPRGGIDTAEGHLSFDQVAQALTESVQKLLGDPARAVEILGAVVNDGVAQRIDAARTLGPVLLDSQAVVHPQFKDARVRTPLIVKLDAKDDAKYLKEWFGPIAFVIATDGTGESLEIARRAAVEHGALTLSLYSTSPAVIDEAVAAAEDAGVALSINLTGGVFVNQSAAFSDYHGTGANPSANAALLRERGLGAGAAACAARRAMLVANARPPRGGLGRGVLLHGRVVLVCGGPGEPRRRAHLDLPALITVVATLRVPLLGDVC